MTRPSRNHDQTLIETAKRLLPEIGVSGMSLKMIADEAGVNIGMFHYHFKSKANFIRQVLQSLSEDVAQDVRAQALMGKTSVEQLRSYLIAIGFTYRSQKKLIVSMYRDVLNQDPEVSAFMIGAAERRLEFLEPLVERCRKEGAIDDAIPFVQISSFCLSAVSFPILIGEALNRLPSKQRKSPKRGGYQLDSDEAIVQRVDMALRAIAKQRMKK